MTLYIPGSLINLTDEDLAEFRRQHPKAVAVRQKQSPAIIFYGYPDGFRIKVIAIHRHRQEKTS